MSQFRFYEALLPILEKAFASQADTLRRVAQKMAEVIAADHLVYVFGAGHAGIIAEEMCYRAGSLVPTVPILAPGLTLNTRPVTLETEIERLPGYAKLLLDASGISGDDMLIIHSNSGRNTVAVEMAEYAREKGIALVALTSLAHSRAYPSRHPRGLKLMDLAEYVIDNCGVVGDAVCPIPGLDVKAGATSTVVGAALMNAIIVEAACILQEMGHEPPLFRSANMDNSDESNKKWMDHYRSRLLYL
ncbi:MAG TPA: SIS domain-containing protein [Anaerolineales bacterium]|jgi:uncharacterized phosphosugar-binding protein